MSFLNLVLRARKRIGATLGSNTLFTDTSEFQDSVYTNAYPYAFASFRCNDGTYVDRKFHANLAWAKTQATSGHVAGFIVYFVWRPNWQQTVDTLKSAVGTPHPKMAIMMDIESWGGQIHGNQSSGINAAREELIKWLGGNRKRVIGYGNAGDLNGIWPSRGDAKIVLANYSSNPSFPGKIAHQYTSSGNVKPFGSPVDVNSADGLSPQQFATALGLVAPPVPPKPAPKPTPIPIKKGRNMSTLFYQVNKAECAAAKTPWPGVFTKGDGNRPEHVLDNESATMIGQCIGVPYGATMPTASLAQHKLWAAGNAALLAPHPDAKIDELHVATGGDPA